MKILVATTALAFLALPAIADVESDYVLESRLLENGLNRDVETKIQSTLNEVRQI